MRLCPLRRFRVCGDAVQSDTLFGEERHSAVTATRTQARQARSGRLGRGPRLLLVERDLGLTGRRLVGGGIVSTICIHTNFSPVRPRSSRLRASATCERRKGEGGRYRPARRLIYFPDALLETRKRGRRLPQSRTNRV
jgi:hypothetical protein